ncbi:MAG: hypothetical protein AB1521_15690 [Bacteroidota bacterium]
MNIEQKICFIPFASDITTMPSTQIAVDLQNELHHFGMEHISENELLGNYPVVYFVLTGGTENKILNLWKQRKEKFGNEPVLLLAHSGNNSLPAALEILARLQQEGAKGKIIFLDETLNKECWHQIEQVVRHFKVFYKLKKTKIGLVGGPSDWLVASMPQFDTIAKTFGVQIEQISIDELKNKITEVKEEEIEEIHHSFVSRAAEVKEPSKKEIKNAVKVYTALKQMIKQYQLDAVSVRCFDLVTGLKTTGCFALAKLNDESVIAGCEGDIVSALGMVWVNYLTDQVVWMANPTLVDEQNNLIWLAHCTIPVSMVNSYKLRSHYESGVGVGIEGELSKGKVTVFRLGDKELNKMWSSNAEIIENGSDENLCRTQVCIKLHGSSKASDILNEPLGNHLLLLRGSYSREIHSWWEFFIE